MLEKLRAEVYEANLELPRRGLIRYTWGNVSGIDREQGLFIIKPSGVAYEQLRPQDLIVVDLAGRKVEGELNPSSDMPTHLELYRAFPEVGGIVHTHSPYATAWAQAGLALPCFGTTQADYFYGEIPCARALTAAEIAAGYETNTGKVIVEAMAGKGPAQIPAVLCSHHGPFTWGRDAADAVYHAVVLEEVAKMNLFTKLLNQNAVPLSRCTLDKHFMRKHGPDAYYGQGQQ